MISRLLGAGVLAAAIVATVLGVRAAMRPPVTPALPAHPEREIPIGPPLLTATAPGAAFVGEELLGDPVVIPGCRLATHEKEDVPSRRDGVLLFIGTISDLLVDVPEDRRLDIQVGREMKIVRRLFEGDAVKAGQLLAQLDDALARDDVAIKRARVAAAEAELAAAEKSKDEARLRYETGSRLSRSNKAMSDEEVRERKLALDKTAFDLVTKQEALKLARVEEAQARTVLGMHEIRSSIDGVIKTIYKNPGEAVKGAASFEPVFQIVNPNRLRAEGLVGEQDVPLLQTGDEVVVEVAPARRARRVLVGHLQEVVAAAVTADSKRIVTASLDGTVRVWDPGSGKETRVLRHPTAVSSVACAPAGARIDLCLVGLTDGGVWAWDLGKDAKEPRWKSQDGHAGAAAAVAFAPGGAVGASGGEDRSIRIWDAATGAPKYHLPGHTGAVTGLQFTPQGELVSTAQDNTVRVWELGTAAGRAREVIDRRSGDVGSLGVHPDGRHVLFDPWQSPSLRVLELSGGRTKAVLNPPSSSVRAAGFALFSPDGRTAATGVAADGAVHLWALPAPGRRAHVRHRLLGGRTPLSCAAFAPDGSFLVAGSPARDVFVWDLTDSTDRKPDDAAGRKSTAVITHVERSLDSNQVRVWAELNGPGSGFLPGASATLVRYPR